MDSEMVELILSKIVGFIDCFDRVVSYALGAK
jgi:hypothetical protein